MIELSAQMYTVKDGKETQSVVYLMLKSKTLLGAFVFTITLVGHTRKENGLVKTCGISW